MSKYSKYIKIILIILGCVLFLAAIVLICVQTGQSARSKALLDALRNDAANGMSTQENSDIASENAEPSLGESSDDNTLDETKENDDTQASEPEDLVSPSIPNPYAESFLKNPDMAGWLVVPDTVIDYPIMWTPEDEEFYLYKDFNGNDDKNGSLILDTESCVDPLTTNLIIHGHNMKSGAMFGNLTAYEKKEYFDTHREIILYTKDCKRRYEVIAVFRSQVYKKSDNVFKYYKFFQADTQEEFDDFYNNIKNLSVYDTGVSAKFGDNFITLSTCTYHVERGRFVVVAKEVEIEDTYLPI